MDRKGIAILAASFVLLLTWMWGLGKMYPPQAGVKGTNAPVMAGASNPVPSTAALGLTDHPIPPSLTGKSTTEASVVPALSQQTLSAGIGEKLLTVENDKVRVTFSSAGGGVKVFEFKNYPAKVTCKKDDPEGKAFATINRPSFLPAFSFANSPELNGDGAFALSASGGSVRAEKTLPSGLKVVREFVLGTNNYEMWVTVRVENSKTLPVVVPEQEIVVGASSPMDAHDARETQGVYWFDGAKAQHIDSRWFENRSFGCMPGTPRYEYRGGASNVVWAAVHNRVFALIAAPDDNSPAPAMIARNYPLPAPSRAMVDADDRLNAKPEAQQAAFLYPTTVLNGGGRLEHRYHVYAGPKEYFTLSRIEPQFDAVMDFTGITGPFAKGLLLALNLLHQAIPSYGWSIVVITIIIKGLFWPLTAISTRSMKKMQAMQPELAALKEKYKDDPRKFQEKNLELMRKPGVNPAAGCLPMLIQFPVLIGFVFMVRTAIELRGEHFLWACDLSQPDTLFVIPLYFINLPFNLLPLLMMCTSVWISHLTPPSPQMDPAQQKMMRYMPIFFVVFFYNYSSGLTLYWTVQNLLTVLQTKLTRMNETKSKPSTPVLPAGGKRR